jgi:hypothetical protein
MDFDAFKKQLDQARELKCAVDGAEFTLTLPTDYDMSVAHSDCRDAEGRANPARTMRLVLMQSVKGWQGVTTRTVWQGAAEDAPLDFSFAALGALLDMRQDVVSRLIAEVTAAREARLARQEAAEKN